MAKRIDATTERQRKLREANRRFRERDPERVRAYARMWTEANRDKLNQNARSRRARDQAYREKIRAQSRDWYNRNRQRETIRQRKKRKDNLAKAAEAQRKWRRKPANRIQNSVRCSMRKVLLGKMKPAKTFQMLGYSSEQLRAHIETKFLPGMTWGNYGKLGWHIDHIRPVASFDFEAGDPRMLGFG